MGQNSKIVSRLSLLLGFGLASTACATPAYGVPSVEFSAKITGSVADAEGNPIEGIVVTPYPNGATTAQGYSGVSDAEGRFSTPVLPLFSLRDLPVKAVDTDGEDNGGDFGERILTVSLSKDDFAGEDYTARGYAVKEANFSLQQKTKPENTNDENK